MFRGNNYHLCSCKDSRRQGKSWTLWPAWPWSLSWFELDSNRCSQPVPLGSPLEHQQRTSWHTVPILDTKNKTNKDGSNHQEKHHANGEMHVGFSASPYLQPHWRREHRQSLKLLRHTRYGCLWPGYGSHRAHHAGLALPLQQSKHSVYGEARVMGYHNSEYSHLCIPFCCLHG